MTRGLHPSHNHFLTFSSSPNTPFEVKLQSTPYQLFAISGLSTFSTFVPCSIWRLSTPSQTKTSTPLLTAALSFGVRATSESCGYCGTREPWLWTTTSIVTHSFLVTPSTSSFIDGPVRQVKRRHLDPAQRTDDCLTKANDPIDILEGSSNDSSAALNLALGT